MILAAPPDYSARLFIPVSQGGFWHRPEPARPPKHVALDRTVDVEVNEGRWIVRCPFCPGAQLAEPGERRFFCVDCLNMAGGGGWVKVRWPAAALEIEAVLGERPEIRTRNWLPDESVADLVAENARFL